MSREFYLYGEFIYISKILNQQLSIVPVLYGSLGLGKATQVDFSPQDIDILVPLTFLEEKWEMLQSTMEQLGYSLIDLSEHEFQKDDIKIGFAYTEDLLDFAAVDYKNLERVEENGAYYHLLTVTDYLKVYSKSFQDGYRRKKNNNKDLRKLEFLKKLRED